MPNSGELLAVAQAFDADGALISEDLATVQIDLDWTITGRSVLTADRAVYVAEVRLLDLAGNVRSSFRDCGMVSQGSGIGIDWHLTLHPKRSRLGDVLEPERETCPMCNGAGRIAGLTS